MTNEVMNMEEVMENTELFINSQKNDIELLRSTAFEPQNDLDEFFLDEFVLTKEISLSLFKRIIALESEVATLKSKKSIRISESADLNYVFEDEIIDLAY